MRQCIGSWFRTEKGVNSIVKTKEGEIKIDPTGKTSQNCIYLQYVNV